MSNIQKKIEELTAELQIVITQHNETLEVKNNLYNKATELQGALKVLKELDVDTDTNPETT